MKIFRMVVLVVAVAALLFGVLLTLADEHATGQSLIIGASIVIAGALISSALADKRN
jgi:drug/metabolite transporter superfamily protein YnfA